ncbi:DUF3021 domain-containing protein [Rossellomorea vietnamensis]|uniref:DUF3021 domain-containing protein n=1 Tax=Rossellomorea vietnamensis TaxID=218284 RepID=A0A5D4K5D6_9BACI|nr:DUF3021 family protein [Rossellomorea vietnamensis]TYR72514.1 DUF3021 domain-containing protein [Rossellomorea vietnamensis]
MSLLLRGLVRGGIPFVILLILSLWNKSQGQTETSSVFFFYGLIAFFLGLTSIIYQINQWSFFKQILAHYTAMLITVFPTLLLSGFYPLSSFTDVIKIYFEFNITGVILFFGTYIVFNIRRNNIRKVKEI